MNVLLSLVLGFGLAAAMVPLCRILARRTGVVAHPRDDRWNRTTVPLLGGLAIGLALLSGALITGIAMDMAVPLVTAVLMCVIGLVDDFLTLKPATKLIAQIAMAAALVYFGYRLNWLESRLFDSLLTIVWVVGITNAFNLLDNMDGLCAGIALIVGTMLIIGLASGVTRQLAGNEMGFLALLVGATAGFLVFNFPPASIFMGDSGALLLGFSLAALTLSPEGVRGSRADVASAIAGPVFVLLIPIFDTSLVTALRLLSGRSPARGGRDHSSHRLVAMGLSERTAVFVLWFLAAVGGGIGNLLRQAEGWSLLAGALFILAMCLFAVYLSRIKVYDDVSAVGPASTITPLLTDFLYKRRVAEVMLDFCLIAIAYYGAYRLRFEGDDYLLNVENFYESLTVVLTTQLVAFFIVGVYRGIWRHFGLMDGVTIAKGVLLGTAAAQLVILYLYHYFSYSRTVFLIYAVLVGVLVIVSRASFRLMGEFVQRRRSGSHRVVIYGAGENARLALRELQEREGESLKVLGFIDDDPWTARMRVQGYPVFGSYERLTALIQEGGVDAVILNHALSDERLASIEELCQTHAVALMRLHIEIEELISNEGPSPATRLRAQLRSSRR
jgi:UDP-GlcNAc:undecaprenyl-phosphate/decaprenyl-phosphate GlcNAc-1-phosphate transferase